MSLPWIQVAKEFARSPEAISLGHDLGIGRRGAVGLCVEFWTWASDQAPDGRVDGALSALVIDDAMGFGPGGPSFSDAMLKVGLLEHDGGGIRIVGWGRYAKALEKAANDATRKRERRASGAETAPERRGVGAGKSQIESQKEEKSSTAGKKSSRAGKGKADARLGPLRDAMVAHFEAIRGCKYAYRNTVDTQAVRRLLKLGADDEVMGRWDDALNSTGFRLSNDIANFARKWNEYSVDPGRARPAAPKFDPNGGIMRSSG